MTHICIFTSTIDQNMFNKGQQEFVVVFLNIMVSTCTCHLPQYEKVVHRQLEVGT